MIFERIASFKILISVGRENPMGMSATPSQEEKILESESQQETPPGPESGLALLSSAASKAQLVLLLLVCLSVLLFFCVASSGRKANYFYNIGYIIPHECAFKMLSCFLMLWFLYCKEYVYFKMCLFLSLEFTVHSRTTLDRKVVLNYDIVLAYHL